MMRKEIITGVLALLGMLLTSGCNSTLVEPTSEAQIESDKFIEELKASGAYTELFFLNEDVPIYYKELADAPAETKGVFPYQNSTVKATLEGEHAITGQKFQPLTTINSLVIYGKASESSSQVVPGMQMALQKMEVGDKWEVVIPWRLGYGSMQSGVIPAYSPLRFTVTLDAIVKP